MLKDTNKTAGDKIKQASKDLIDNKKLIESLEFSTKVDNGNQNKFGKELNEFVDLMNKFTELEKNPNTEVPLKEALASLIEAAKNAVLSK
jgi:ribosomal 50S subunit-associated protein YjgA (DUF615 family)